VLIDAHNHLQDARLAGHVDDIVALMKRIGITACIVNGTDTADWHLVAELAEKYPGYVLPSFGLHPWKVKGRAGDWAKQLESFLRRFPESGVGEIGLDRWIEDHDIEDQKIVFREQLNLAVKLNRPCTIHCLRAWGPLLDELKAIDQLPRFLVHSFGGSIETGRKLTKLGAYFSFSGHFLHQRKEKVVDVFRKLPQDRILVETDAPDMLPPERDRPHGDAEINHPANLFRIRSRLTELIGITHKQLADNTQRWWGDVARRVR
jgi:TatD DNase family protein